MEIPNSIENRVNEYEKKLEMSKTAGRKKKYDDSKYNRRYVIY